ncbi:MAG: hypothetical protein Kow0062_07420 [Acidobacteriota bacterium]
MRPTGLSCFALVLASALLVGCEAGPDDPDVRPDLLAIVEDDRSWAEFVRNCVAQGPRCTDRVARQLDAGIRGDRARPIVAIRLGGLLQRLGLRDEALGAYRRALIQARGTGDVRSTITARYRLAALSADEETRSREFAELADLANRHGYAELEVRLRYATARALRAQGRLEEELLAWRQLVDRYRALVGNDRLLGRALLGLADAERRTGRLEDSISTLERIRGLAERDDDPELLDLVLFQRAAIHLQLGDAEKAVADLEAARRLAGKADPAADRQREIEVLLAGALIRSGRVDEGMTRLGALRESGSGPDALVAAELALFEGEGRLVRGEFDASVASFERAVHEASRTGNPELARIARADLASALLAAGRSDKALDQARRAVSLIEKIRAGAPADDGKVFFLRVRADAYTVLARAALAQHPPRLEEAFRAIERSHARALRESLARAGGSAGPVAADLAAVRRRLASDELMLVWQLGEPASLLLLIDRDTIVAHELPGRRALRRELAHFRRLLVAPLVVVGAGNAVRREAPATLVAAGRTLLRSLFGGAVDRVLAATRLIAVPEGELFDLPLEALPLPAPTAGAGVRYLGDDRAIRYLPAASLLSEEPCAVPRNVLVVRGPPAWPEQRLDGLEHLDDEAESVAALWGRAARLAGPLAESSGFGRRLGGRRVDVLHLAAHAVLTTRSGPRILLGRDDGGGEIVLDAGSVAALAPAPRLVVLSSCDSGRGELVRGEGVLGLVRAFTLAGTESVVVSLWPVDDAATLEMMSAFHRALRAGEDPGAALERARATTRERYPHPWFWAGFVVYGACGGQD